MGIVSFRQLVVWRKAHEAVLEVYRMTRAFPAEERFGLTMQMRRAAVSVPANIAEGFGRRRPMDKARFYTIAEGSAQELAYFLDLCRDLGYARDLEVVEARVAEVARMLRALTDRTLEIASGRASGEPS